MKALLVIAIYLWWAITATPARAVVTFDFTEEATGNSYSTSIVSLRDQLTSKTVKYGVQVMQKPAKEPSFLLVDLKAASNKIITLALNIFDLYVVGYRDTYNGKDRAHFFPSTPEKVKSELFKDATRQDIPFGENYVVLENEAKVESRRDIELGIDKQRFAIESVFGKQKIDRKIEAKFLIISIQMISEAARFKYIENQVRSGGSFFPDYKVLSLENNWQSISGAFQKSKDGKISLKLKYPNNSEWEVKNVAEISPDLGILKYVAWQYLIM